MKQLILAAIVALPFSFASEATPVAGVTPGFTPGVTVGVTAWAPAAVAPPIDDACSTNFPGFPIVPPCADNESRDLLCFNDARDAYLAAWTATVKPLLEVGCTIQCQLDVANANLATHEQAALDAWQNYVNSRALCNNGSWLACLELPFLLARYNAAENLVGQTILTIARLDSLLEATEAAIFAAEADIITTFLAAAAACCQAE